MMAPSFGELQDWDTILKWPTNSAGSKYGLMPIQGAGFPKQYRNISSRPATFRAKAKFNFRFNTLHSNE